MQSIFSMQSIHPSPINSCRTCEKRGSKSDVPVFPAKSEGVHWMHESFWFGKSWARVGHKWTMNMTIMNAKVNVTFSTAGDKARDDERDRMHWWTRWWTGVSDTSAHHHSPLVINFGAWEIFCATFLFLLSHAKSCTTFRPSSGYAGTRKISLGGQKILVTVLWYQKYGVRRPRWVLGLQLVIITRTSPLLVRYWNCWWHRSL